MALQLYKFRHGDDTKKKYECLPKWGISIERGKVLIWAQQSIGDEVFFEKFLLFLKKPSNIFYLECDKRLHEVISQN